MHLLVLSAFRQGATITDKKGTWSLNAPFGAQCFPTIVLVSDRVGEYGSQCTFWCSVLSDADIDEAKSVALSVSMHLLVLSAFRPSAVPSKGRFYRVSMHLLVLSAFRHADIPAVMHRANGLNAPFGAQCFPTAVNGSLMLRCLTVSMHLLVLSAFRPTCSTRLKWSSQSQCTFWCSVLSDLEPVKLEPSRHGLNAPFGAQCFPTQRLDGRSEMLAFASQCTFWCSVLSDLNIRASSQFLPVSMHLLVLSAFRLKYASVYNGKYVEVSMHLLVLSAFRRGESQ